MTALHTACYAVARSSRATANADSRPRTTAGSPTSAKTCHWQSAHRAAWCLYAGQSMSQVNASMHAISSHTAGTLDCLWRLQNVSRGQEELNLELCRPNKPTEVATIHPDHATACKRAEASNRCRSPRQMLQTYAAGISFCC